MNNEMNNKYKNLFVLLDRWMMLENQGTHTKEYFEKYDYHKVAIYGMGRLGRWLVRTLKDASVDIVYAIDQRSNIDMLGVDKKNLEDELPDVDVVIVTAIEDFDDIELKICSRLNVNVVSLDEVIAELELMRG